MKKAGAKPKAKWGRVSTFSQKIADKIVDLIAGGKTLTEACKSPGMPNRRTVQRWCHQFPEFDRQYQRSQELLADALFDEIKAIADDGTGDVTIDAKGRQRVDWENVNRSKLRVETRKWLAAQLNPRKYGDKLRQEIEQTTKVEITRTTPLTAEEVAIELRNLLGEAEHEMGLTHANSETNEQRIERIKQMGGGILPPRIYTALYELERGPGDRIH